MGQRKQRPTTGPRTEGPFIPEALAATLAPLLGDERPALEQALRGTPPTVIRLNPLRPFTLEAERVPWCATGRYLAERPSFTFDPLLHAGAYYVQEASSMLLEQAVRASGALNADIRALDLCAAPGGKSTHLRALLTPGSLLVANEVDHRRRSPLEENLWKWGGPNVVITGSDPQHLQGLPGFFDLIVVDAPCSGEGMFRKEPFAREQWSPALVEQCVAVQQRIVPLAWEALAPGGTLIYSTCTWEPRENEDQVRSLIEAGGQCIALDIDPAWGVERTEVNGVIGHRCYPHRLRGEGFFLSAVRKPGEREQRTLSNAAATHAAVQPWLLDPASRSISENEGVLYMVDAHWERALREVGSALRVTAPGIPVAERKGDGWTPHAALALNGALDRTAFPQRTLSYDEAIRYLRGEALQATEAAGAALALYAGHPLGWLQGAGKRWNNRWPAPWRIRAQQANAPRVSWAT